MNADSVMHFVGHHLQMKAHDLATQTDQGAEATSQLDQRDAFARSAFNRYYYGVFLTARNMIIHFDPKWGECHHSDYPKLLRGKIKKRLKNARKQKKNLNNLDLNQRLGQAISSADTLADIMNIANKVRVAADYNLEKKIKFQEKRRFVLESINISDAHMWESRARKACTKIQQGWDSINV